MAQVSDTVVVNGRTKQIRCPCLALNRAGHHPTCRYYVPPKELEPVKAVPQELGKVKEVAISTEAETLTQQEGDSTMARRNAAAKVENVEPAAVNEVRAWLLENGAPEGVNVAGRGRLSTAAKEYFTEKTGRPVAAPQTASAE